VRARSRRRSSSRRSLDNKVKDIVVDEWLYAAAPDDLLELIFSKDECVLGKRGQEGWPIQRSRRKHGRSRVGGARGTAARRSSDSDWRVAFSADGLNRFRSALEARSITGDGSYRVAE
jgi:hypothetical protein